MRYIIWGAGLRGKIAYEMLGSANVVAFIDRDKQGQTFLGKDVLSFEDAKKQFSDVIYVVTPLAATNSIMHILDQEGIQTKLAFDAYPMEYAFVDDGKSLFELYPIEIEKDECILQGINIFALLFYNYLLAKGKKVWLQLTDEQNEIWNKCLSSEYELILEKEPIRENCIYVQMQKDDGKKENRNAVSIEELLRSYISYQSPAIKSFKGTGVGKRCFIVATGPSLKVEDLEVLHANHEICFSMNKIYNIFSQTKWRPDYYMAQDAHMIEEVGDEIVALDIPNKFIVANANNFWNEKTERECIRFYSLIEAISSELPGFSDTPEYYMYDGKTITYACLQMAIYMGFSEIYLIGVDFNYAKDINSEANHFAGYHGGQKNLNLFPFQYECVENAYRVARMNAEKKGIRILNATRGGKLEVFERVHFDDLFS